MTSPDLLNELAATVVDHRTKGIPLGERLAVGEIGKRGWKVARGDLALPVTTLSQSALDNNIAAMQEYCARHGVLLAPHGKTTMSPQLFHRQLAAGAWGITAATPTQLAIMRDFGVPRVIVANEIVEPDALRWIAREMEADPAFEVLALADDAGRAAAADQALEGVARTRPLRLLLEAGVPGGRTGVRTPEDAMSVARAVASARHLALAGIEIFEGLNTGAAAAEDLAQIDRALDEVRDLVYRIAAEQLFEGDEIIVSAGGSAYFDRVLERLNGPYNLAVPVQLILRSGCYISHDLGVYHRVSPLDGRRSGAEDLRLINALQGWARVLSRPEPELAILGTGKRDLPYDFELPIPLTAYDMSSQGTTDLRGVASINKMMDQHAFMAIREDVPLSPGDIVSVGMSHPCTAFDKTRLIPIIDDNSTVVDAVLTFF